MVVQLERLDAINTRATLYVNPTAGLVNPGIVSVGTYTYNTGNLIGLGVYSNSATTSSVFDEIRVGSSYASVAPAASAIPEPSTYAVVAGVFAIGIATWKKRRQRRPAHSSLKLHRNA